MNVSFKMPLVPPTRAAALGQVVSSQRLPKNPVEFFARKNISESGALGFVLSEV